MCAVVLPRGLGVAVKVRDGSPRAGPPAHIRVLEKLSALDGGDVSDLAYFARPPVLGGEGPVGEIHAEFDLTLA